ncbi:hypothetical protein [Achromobacter arsenitoxydans]|uniref:Lipoprotein n=1 Tax=Achromobacter arsenitoxydans SY8 TaxID=477184 RepID=H0FB01_9BURK|nr:hypothetical protein [Achromobacter arsenitoxydans]EHK64564.1 hypothetical protein KYC_19789 [Achromobacter arsenitoxydans SY8]
MRTTTAVSARPSRIRGLTARLALAAAASLAAGACAQAQQWFDVPPHRDLPNASIRISGQPDSRQASGTAKGKMEFRYASPQAIPGANKNSGRYNRSVTDVMFSCRRTQVGFLPATSYYMNDKLIASVGDETPDERQVQFVRFPEDSPQMKALRVACGK